MEGDADALLDVVAADFATGVFDGDAAAAAAAAGLLTFDGDAATAAAAAAAAAAADGEDGVGREDARVGMVCEGGPAPPLIADDGLDLAADEGLDLAADDGLLLPALPVLLA